MDTQVKWTECRAKDLGREGGKAQGRKDSLQTSLTLIKGLQADWKRKQISLDNLVQKELTWKEKGEEMQSSIKTITADRDTEKETRLFG